MTCPASKIRIRPLPLFAHAKCRSWECAAYSSVLVVVDVVKVNATMGAGMHSVVVDEVEMNVIMGAGMPSVLFRMI